MRSNSPLLMFGALALMACDNGQEPPSSSATNSGNAGGNNVSQAGSSAAGNSAVSSSGATGSGVITNGGSGGAVTAMGGATSSGGEGGGDDLPGGGAGSGDNPSDSGIDDVPVDFSDPIAVVPSLGCGSGDLVASGTFTIQTMGSKAADCADSVCGDWSSQREYTIFLPQDYNQNQTYTLVFLGPGCGGASTNIFSIDNNAANTAIRVGIKPSADAQVVHATNPNQGCFDDHEGDDSVDWVLYEDLYDLLNTQLCFDRNRVFTGGVSSGANFANELGCKYAGDSVRPIRGVMASKGELPDEPEYRPTCSEKPTAGLWISAVEDGTYPFEGVKAAIDHALALNDCVAGTSYETATFESFPVGGGIADDTCKRVMGCDPLYPVIVCPLPGNGNQTSHDTIANPAFSRFLQTFLLTPLAAP